MTLDFKGLSQSLLDQARDLLPKWFPAGKFNGAEFVVGDVSGNGGRSLSINWRKGVWKDFSSDEAGADLISLFAAQNGLTQGQAFKTLSGTSDWVPFSPRRTEAREEVEVKRITSVSPPDDVARPTFIHHRHGPATAVHEYRGRAGECLGFISRHDPPGSKKQFIPWMWDAEGKGWVNIQFDEPRPLYGLDLLDRYREKGILLCEGEKSADAARRIAGHTYNTMAWPGGASAIAKVDWEALGGKKVVIWPDNDEAGMKAARAIAEILSDKAESVKIIDPAGKPDKWDAADAVADGMSWQTFFDWAKVRVSTWNPRSSEEKVRETKRVVSSTLQDRIELWGSLGLELAGEGKGPIPNLDNICRVLECWSGFCGSVWYDTFREKVMTRWEGDQREWADADDLRLTRQIQAEIAIPRVSVETVHQALLLTAHRHKRNELTDWLGGLEWDGTDRLKDLISIGFGSVASDYHSQVGRCWILGMVARALQPGCKVDTMPILEGIQGAGKSSALGILGGQWFAECHESVTSKDFYQVLKGAWLVEISEMHSFNRTEVERIKGVISCATDRYRAPYGRSAEDHPRQSVFAGTTNRDDWQRDDTGARRFWAVACGTINSEWLIENRSQLFAEAVHRVKAKESWWNVPTADAESEAAFRRPGDTWEDAIKAYVEKEKSYTTTGILDKCIGLELSKQDRVSQLRVASAMRSLNWESKTSRNLMGAVTRIWTKIRNKP